MATAALKRAEAAETRAASANKRARDEKKEGRNRGEHLIVTLGAAYLLGMAEKKKTKLPTIGRVDAKMLYGTGALVAAYMTKDKRTKRVLNSAGDGVLAIVAYETGMGKSGTIIDPATTEGMGYHDAETHVVEEGEIG